MIEDDAGMEQRRKQKRRKIERQALFGSPIAGSQALDFDWTLPRPSPLNA